MARHPHSAGHGRSHSHAKPITPAKDLPMRRTRWGRVWMTAEDRILGSDEGMDRLLGDHRREPEA